MGPALSETFQTPSLSGAGISVLGLTADDQPFPLNVRPHLGALFAGVQRLPCPHKELLRDDFHRMVIDQFDRLYEEGPAGQGEGLRLHPLSSVRRFATSPGECARPYAGHEACGSHQRRDSWRIIAIGAGDSPLIRCGGRRRMARCKAGDDPAKPQAAAGLGDFIGAPTNRSL